MKDTQQSTCTSRDQSLSLPLWASRQRSLRKWLQHRSRSSSPRPQVHPRVACRQDHPAQVARSTRTSSKSVGPMDRWLSSQVMLWRQQETLCSFNSTQRCVYPPCSPRVKSSGLTSFEIEPLRCSVHLRPTLRPHPKRNGEQDRRFLLRLHAHQCFRWCNIKRSHLHDSRQGCEANMVLLLSGKALPGRYGRCYQCVCVSCYGFARADFVMYANKLKVLQPETKPCKHSLRSLPQQPRI